MALVRRWVLAVCYPRCVTDYDGLVVIGVTKLMLALITWISDSFAASISYYNQWKQDSFTSVNKKMIYHVPLASLLVAVQGESPSKVGSSSYLHQYCPTNNHQIHKSHSVLYG